MNEIDAVRLTQFAKRAGCAAKQPPDYLLSLLAGLPPITDPNVIVGHATSDDAAVYKLSDDLALILTTDFFTPIVDRPYDFGAIAAANALSDVYAMAGTPLAALSLVGFPSGALPPEVLFEIMKGAADKASEAGIAIVGGHTIQADEPTFGLAVVGRIHPRDLITNAGARPGDFLVLTKPLGLGIITTASKRGEDDQGAIAEAITLMTTLNRDAARIFAAAGAHALTDVTGFGLLGMRNLAAASGASALIWSGLVLIKESLPAKKLVYYGKVIGGRPGFIALDLLPAFLRLRIEPGGFLKMYRRGQLSLCAKLVMDALSRRGVAETRALKLSSGFDRPSRRGEFDRAMKELQERFLALKVEERHEPFTYVWDTMEHRWGAALKQARALSKSDAGYSIARRYFEVAGYATEKAAARLLGINAAAMESASRRLEREGVIVRGARLAGMVGSYSVLAKFVE